MNNKPRVIAFYLPQFHPIPENDEWWGKGFTEWTNVGKAKPFFKGHYQPRIPADLGYYDLRLPEVRQAQANLAREYGIEGFAYWHYWFGNGRRLLEMPFNEVLNSGKPEFPFCLAWANETWKGFNHGLSNRNVLIEQLYPGDEDYTEHFYSILPAFKDTRYIKVDGNPIFIIYKPYQLPDATQFIKLWQQLALENGIGKIYFVAHLQYPVGNNKSEKECYDEMINWGFDAVTFVRLSLFLQKRNLIDKIYGKVSRLFKGMPLAYPYKRFLPYLTNSLDNLENVFPSILSGWDHSPRSGREGLVLTKTTPELFGNHVKQVLEKVDGKPKEKKVIFLKSWNEWAEGNYMEPDIVWGHQFLEELKKHISE